MGGKGSQTVNTAQTQTYTPDPFAYASIKGALQQAQDVSQTPFQTPVAPVAGFSDQQQQAFNITNQAQGQAQPYFNQAAQYFSPQGAQQFLNPFASNVMASMQDVFGQQMREATGNLTQQAGGVGADRIAVGQAQLANQQGLAAGQTMGNLYGQAAQQAQTAAYGTANLGSAAQNATLQGAQALLGTGGLQQQLQQAQLNAPYQNILQQISWPYQNAQFLGGLTAALAPGLGGTTSGTGSTTFPPQNPLGSILGGLTAGAGLIGKFAKRGGRISPYPRLAVDNTRDGGGRVNPYAFADGGDTDSVGGDDDVGISYHDIPIDQNNEAVGSAEKAQLAQSASGDPGAQMAAMKLPSGLGTAPVNVAPKSEVPNVKVNPIPVHMPNLDLRPPQQSGGSSGGKGSGLGGLTSLIGLAALARGGAAPSYAPGGRASHRHPFAYDDGGGVDFGGVGGKGSGFDDSGGGGGDGGDSGGTDGFGDSAFNDSTGGLGDQTEIMQNLQRLEDPIKVEPPGNDTAAAGNLADNTTVPQATKSPLFGRNPYGVQPLGTEMPPVPAAAAAGPTTPPEQPASPFDGPMARQIKERQGLEQGLSQSALQQQRAVQTVTPSSQSLAAQRSNPIGDPTLQSGFGPAPNIPQAQTPAQAPAAPPMSDTQLADRLIQRGQDIGQYDPSIRQALAENAGQTGSQVAQGPTPEFPTAPGTNPSAFGDKPPTQVAKMQDDANPYQPPADADNATPTAFQRAAQTVAPPGQDETADQGPALGYADRSGDTRGFQGAAPEGKGSGPGGKGAGTGRKHTFGSSPWDHLLMAGLGIMAASGQRDAHGLPMSPLAAVGSGALAGLKTSTSVEQAAQKLDQAAEFHADQYNKLTAAQKLTDQREREKMNLERLKPFPVGQGYLGETIYGRFDKSGKIVDAVTGRPIDPSSIAGGGLGSDQPSQPQQAAGPQQTPQLPPGAQASPPGQGAQPSPLPGQTGPAAPQGGQPLQPRSQPPSRPGFGPTAVPNVGNVDQSVLQNLPTGIANEIMAIDEGRESLTSVPYKQRAQVQKILNAYDPSFDQTTWAARNKTQSDLSPNGNSGKLLLATNQLLPHLKTASDKAQALENSAYPAANTIKNWWATATGDPRVKQFNAVREVASLDAARLLRGSGQMSEKDIEQWRALIADAGSPPQLQGVLGLLADDLIGARVSSIEHSYRMNMHKEPPDLVSKEAKEALKVIQSRQPGGGEAAAAPAAVSTPFPPAGTRRQFKQGWGVSDGTKWVPE